MAGCLLPAVLVGAGREGESRARGGVLRGVRCAVLRGVWCGVECSAE